MRNERVVRPRRDLAATREGWTKTTCPYCGVGCGLAVRPRPDGGVDMRGDPDHPANFGRLCSKGSALGETLSLDDRLLHPLVDGQRTTWERALDRIAERFSSSIAEHGPDSVAFYVSGQILTEDYYIANKLMKGFIGSANIDTNSRLCMASSVAGHKRAFGSDTVPGVYEDLEIADLVVLVGSNLAWCHPVLYQRLAEARNRHGTRIVVIDPRRTATCEIADLHLPITPGTDVALFNGLLQHLAGNGHIDEAFVRQHTSGLMQALEAAQTLSVSEVCALTGLDGQSLTAFYDLFSRTERTVTVYSQGVNQSSTGTDKVNAIINCHLATGRIGRPGLGPFSVTGQPNAMGGRETGGLANMLAAHMDLENPLHRQTVQSFWNAPTLPSKQGLKAVDMFDAVEQGRIKAIWIMATNPVASMPEADKVRDALSACPFVVVSEVVSHTDTARLADVLLPSTAWGEKDGTVTNSERRISRQRAFLPAPGEAKPDWWQLAELARRLGHGPAFAFRDVSEIFAEYARLTALDNAGSRDLDIGAHAAITTAAYNRLRPFQWPQPAGRKPAATRFFADGQFYTGDKRARFVATPFRAPIQQTSPAYPIVLNTGRIRDQWHTMTRTGKAPRLTAHVPEPFVAVSPGDAQTLRLCHAHLAEVRSTHGSILARVQVTDEQNNGSVFVPMHWTGEQASQSRIDAVVGGATDPVSGQPELKHSAVAVRPFPARWYGYAVTTTRPSLSHAEYVVVAPVPRGYRVELAGAGEPENVDTLARKILGTAGHPGEILAYHDKGTGQHRFAGFADATMIGSLFIGRRPITVAREWVARQLGRPLAPEERLRLLAGRPGSTARDAGPLVCACYEVGRNTIVEAIVGRGLASVAAVGACLKAGTNCGSCRTEIGRLIDAARLEKAG